MKIEPFIIERIFNAHAERVWKAITDKDQMKEWYFDLDEFKPEVGFEFQFEGGKDGKCYVHLCKITEVVEGKKLQYSWRYQGYEGNSFVTFELFPEGDKTRLRLTHEGLETFPKTNPDLARENFMEGWNYIIGASLQEYVEKSKIKRTLAISAKKEKVWNVLTNPKYTRQWASAFSEGSYVESNWQTGSEVIWKDKEGNIGAKGMVEINQFASILKVRFYDDNDMASPEPLGKYTEAFILQENNTEISLTAESGPVSSKEYDSHSPLWDKALTKIKELAEE